MDPLRLHERLASLLGRGRARLVTDEDQDVRIYDPHPRPLVHVAAQSKEEVALVLAAATTDGFAVVPVGGNTAPHAGPLPEGGLVLLSVELLDRVIAHEVGDLTLTVEAGAAVGEIKSRLARFRQKIGIEPPFPDRATIGGVIAARAEGPCQTRFGPVRDQVIGIEIVHGDGTTSKSGGRVVKNVTGYDLAKLYCGSEGALGIVTSATFRLRPVAEHMETLLLGCNSLEAALGAWSSVRQTAVTPNAMTVIGVALAETALGREPWLVAIRLEGAPRVVDAFRDDILRAVGNGLPAYTMVGADAEVLWDEVATPAKAFGAETPSWHFRIVTRPSLVGNVVEFVSRLRHDERMAVVIHPEVGTCHVLLEGREDLNRAGPEVYAPVDALLSETGSSARVDSDPYDGARLWQRFPSRRGAAWDLGRRLKAVYDRASIMNPGRTPLG